MIRMITREQIENIKNQLKEIEPEVNKVIKELNRPLGDYGNKWDYAFERRLKEATEIWISFDNLKSSMNWCLSQGLVDIDITENRRD